MAKLSIFDDYSLLARLKRRRNAVFDALYIDINRKYSASRFLVGSGRSGTTWAAELLNYDNIYRFVSEPFNRGHVPLCRNFAPRQYLRPADDDLAFLGPARTIFSGRIRNDWTDSQNRRMICTQRLVKDVRSTLMLKWISCHFPTMPIAFMTRHPCAVAYSRAKLGWNARIRDTFLGQSDLVEDFLLPFREAMMASDRPFTTHVFDWCVENYVPLMQLKRADAHMVFYERLCLDPDSETQRLCSHFGRPFNAAAIRLANRPSATTRPGKQKHLKLASPEQLVDGWRSHVSSDDMHRATEILHLFGLDCIYGADSMPKVDNALESLEKPAKATALAV